MEPSQPAVVHCVDSCGGAKDKARPRQGLGGSDGQSSQTSRFGSKQGGITIERETERESPGNR
eukprot:3148710-Pleurochrysis_carterae.AAC.1